MEHDSQDTACFVGIDVAKRQLDVCIRPAGIAFAVPRDGPGLEDLLARLRMLDVRLIVLEATGGFERVVTATLAGARIASDGRTATFTRDLGRAGLPEQSVLPGAPAVWDGRFEILSDAAATVRPLGGLSRRLPRTQQAALRALPAMMRPTLPVMVSRDGAVSCPILAGDPSVRVTTLVLPRFEAAIGLVDAEPAL